MRFIHLRKNCTSPLIVAISNGHTEKDRHTGFEFFILGMTAHDGLLPTFPPRRMCPRPLDYHPCLRSAVPVRLASPDRRAPGSPLPVLFTCRRTLAFMGPPPTSAHQWLLRRNSNCRLSLDTRTTSSAHHDDRSLVR